MSIPYRVIRHFIDRALSPSLRSAAMRWLVSPIETEEKDKALRRLWNETPSERDATTLPSLRVVNNQIDRFESRSRMNVRRVLLRAAVVLLPLLSCALTYLYTSKKGEPTEMIERYVAYGSDERITLPDGSVVNINPGSVLIYPKQFEHKYRTVYLSGEATFHVERNVESPFTVRSGVLSIEVLGTSFNVQAYPASGEVITTLQEGAVEVFKTELSNQTHRLKPNDRLTYNTHTGSFTLAHVSQTEARLIAEGQLVFTNQPLDKILSTIQRRYGVEIINHTIQRDSFSMKFKKTESLDDVLNIVTKTVGKVSYTYRNNCIRIEELKTKNR